MFSESSSRSSQFDLDPQLPVAFAEASDLAVAVEEHEVEHAFLIGLEDAEVCLVVPLVPVVLQVDLRVDQRVGF
jgi:hypothetical protein